MDDRIKKVIRNFGFPETSFIGKGIESIVLDNQDGTVSKIYDDGYDIDSLMRLKYFYNSLNPDNFPTKLPLIKSIKNLKNSIVIIENKLNGVTPNKDFLNSLSSDDLEKFLNNYLDVSFKIKEIKTSFLHEGEALSNSGRFFALTKTYGWKDLLEKSVNTKVTMYKDSFEKHVTDFDSKVQKLKDSLKELNIKDITLIHGDYYPENLLVDENLNVVSVLDFGFATTKGDYVFDVFCAWAFSDMFDEVKTFNTKEYLLNEIAKRLDPDSMKRFYLYLLVYSVIGAHFVSSMDSTDGQFLWCINNLNSDYWDKIE